MSTNSLEQEAMDRVRRMYASFDARANPPERRADEKPEHHADTAGKKRSVRADAPAAEKPAARRSEPKPSKPNSLIDVFLKDRDQSLVLLLLVLLMRDGADMNLMLALMYILI